MTARPRLRAASIGVVLTAVLAAAPVVVHWQSDDRPPAGHWWFAVSALVTCLLAFHLGRRYPHGLPAVETARHQAPDAEVVADHHPDRSGTAAAAEHPAEHEVPPGHMPAEATRPAVPTRRLTPARAAAARNVGERRVQLARMTPNQGPVRGPSRVVARPGSGQVGG